MALGNFNPAILTPAFLKDVCGLDLGEVVDQSPSMVPVHRLLVFKGIQITLNMSRLEIMETGIKNGNIYETRVLRVFNAYYKSLPHTPLTAVGINIRCTLIPAKEADLGTLAGKVKAPQTYLTFFDVAQIDVTERSTRSHTEANWISSNYRVDDVDHLTRLINVEKDRGALRLNYNCEAGNLTKDMSRLRLLISGYDKFCEEFSRFVRYLEARFVERAQTFTRHESGYPDLYSGDTQQARKNGRMDFLAEFILRRLQPKGDTLSEPRGTEGDTSGDTGSAAQLKLEGTIDWTDLALQQLDRVYDECSEPAWDGYEADPISLDTYLEARKLLSMIPVSLPQPEISAEPDGEIGFEWYKDRYSVFVVSVGGNNILTYAALFGKDCKANGTEFLGRALPPSIVPNVKRVFA